MTPAEVRAYNAGVEAVRAFALGRVEDHQARIRRDPDRPWSVTLGFVGAFGTIASQCERLRLPKPSDR